MVNNDNFEIIEFTWDVTSCNLMGWYIIDITEKPSIPYLEDFEISRLDIH